MSKEILHIDDFEAKCGYSYRDENYCNGGHNCKHPEAPQENGIGYCYAFSCPIAVCADEEDFINNGKSLEDYEEDMFVIPNSEFVGGE